MQLALLTFVIFPVLAIGTALFRVYSTRAYRRTRERVADVLATLQETLPASASCRASGARSPPERLFRRVNDEYREANMSTVRLSGVYFPGVELLAGIGTAIILYFGSTRVLDQDLSVGVMVAFVGYLSSFFDPDPAALPALQHLPVGDGGAGEDLRRAGHRARAGRPARPVPLPPSPAASSFAG